MRRVFLIVPHGEQVVPSEGYATRRMAELARQARAVPGAFTVREVAIHGAKLRRGVIWHGKPRPARLCDILPLPDGPRP